MLSVGVISNAWVPKYVFIIITGADNEVLYRHSNLAVSGKRSPTFSHALDAVLSTFGFSRPQTFFHVDFYSFALLFFVVSFGCFHFVVGERHVN
jgi:hypothetical protein